MAAWTAARVSPPSRAASAPEYFWPCGTYITLVPGAGLEPARTLPGPRDFKSTNYCHHQQLSSTKTLYQREIFCWYSVFPALSCSWFGYNRGYSLAVARAYFNPRNFDRSRHVNENGHRSTPGLLIPRTVTTSRNTKAFSAV
jgi:hypothetical protein